MRCASGANCEALGRSLRAHFGEDWRTACRQRLFSFDVHGTVAYGCQDDHAWDQVYAHISAQTSLDTEYKSHAKADAAASNGWRPYFEQCDVLRAAAGPCTVESGRERTQQAMTCVHMTVAVLAIQARLCDLSNTQSQTTSNEQSLTQMMGCHTALELCTQLTQTQMLICDAVLEALGKRLARCMRLCPFGWHCPYLYPDDVCPDYHTQAQSTLAVRFASRSKRQQIFGIQAILLHGAVHSLLGEWDMLRFMPTEIIGIITDYVCSNRRALDMSLAEHTDGFVDANVFRVATNGMQLMPEVNPFRLERMCPCGAPAEFMFLWTYVDKLPTDGTNGADRHDRHDDFCWTWSSRDSRIYACPSLELARCNCGESCGYCWRHGKSGQWSQYGGAVRRTSRPPRFGSTICSLQCLEQFYSVVCDHPGSGIPRPVDRHVDSKGNCLCKPRVASPPCPRCAFLAHRKSALVSPFRIQRAERHENVVATFVTVQA